MCNFVSYMVNTNGDEMENAMDERLELERPNQLSRADRYKYKERLKYLILKETQPGCQMPT